MADNWSLPSSSGESDKSGKECKVYSTPLGPPNGGAAQPGKHGATWIRLRVARTVVSVLATGG
jgi:hypothetical protein